MAKCLAWRSRPTRFVVPIIHVIAAAIEQNHDDRGIIWTEAIAPFQVALVPIGMAKSERVRETVEKLYADLVSNGVEVLLDDRNERLGVMLSDIELIGIPHRVVIGERSLENGVAEYQHRATGEGRGIPLDSLLSELLELAGT